MNGVGRMAAAGGRAARRVHGEEAVDIVPVLSVDVPKSRALAIPSSTGRARLCQSLTELLTEPAVTCHAITGGATKPGQTSQSGQ